MIFFSQRVEIAKRREKEKIIDKHQKNFLKSKEHFTTELENCETMIKNMKDSINDLASLKPGLDELIALEGKFSHVNSLKDDFQKKGNCLVKEDESRVLAVQNEMTSFLIRWENLSDQLKHETDIYCNLQQALTGFNVIQFETNSLLSQFENTLFSLEKAPADSTEAYVLREKCKDLVDKITINKHYFEKLENAKKNVFQMLKDIPNFHVPEITCDMEVCRARWKKVIGAAKDRLGTSDMEVKLWQQIEESRNQLITWIQETKEDLSIMLTNLVDVDTARFKLKSYNEQMKVNINLKDNILTKREKLLQINGERSVYDLNKLLALLDEGFNELTTIGNKLTALVDESQLKENQLKKLLKDATKDLGPIKQKLTKLDDVSGSIYTIYERLMHCNKVKKELDMLQPVAADIEKLNSEIIQLNPYYINSNTINDAHSFKKLISDISSRVIKAESVLESFIKKNLKEKLNDLENSVHIYNNRINLHLPEENFDKDQILSKMESLNETVSEFNKISDKKTEIETLYALLIDNNLETVISEFEPLETILLSVNSFYETADNVKNILQKQIEFMEKYDCSYNKIVSGISNLEGQLNIKGRDLIDTAKIDDEIKKVQNLNSECSQIWKNVEELKVLENELQNSDFKPKIKDMIILTEKIKLIDDYINSRSKKMNGIVEYFSKYRDKVEFLDSFLMSIEAHLNEFEETSEKGNKNLDVMKDKLKELKKLSSIKEIGIPLLNEITEISEILSLNLTPESRDHMRSKLKNLRSSLESLSEKWNLLLKKTERLILQKVSVEDNSKQILQWMTSIENKVEPEMELKETLPDKRKSLNLYRTLLQDVQSHKPIIEQLVNKMELIPYEETTSDVLLSRYKQLHDRIENYVNILGKYVANHENYFNSFENLKDFLDVLGAEEIKCNDCCVDDKISIYESIIPQINVGNSIVELCEKSLIPVLTETNDVGKKMLNDELNLQKQNLMEFATKCQETLKELVEKRNRDENVRIMISELDNFLKGVESNLKDQSLKNNLDAKKIHLQDVKVIFDIIESKNEEFNFLKKEASETSSDLTESCLKLVNRYQNVKQKAKVCFLDFFLILVLFF